MPSGPVRLKTRFCTSLCANVTLTVRRLMTWFGSSMLNTCPGSLLPVTEMVEVVRSLLKSGGLEPPVLAGGIGILT